VGSGFIVHNLRAMRPGQSTIPSWATDFDAWTGQKLEKRDIDALVEYRKTAPGVDMALPTHEHFVPVLVALGASVDRAEPVKFPIMGNWFGAFTKRSVQFG
jgi:4,5-DOPA dioxygenase extradiol